MRHGIVHSYDKGCRCVPCSNAKSDYAAARAQGVHRVDRELLAELLHELFPHGLTDDCPARRERRIAA
jgi:hypothetical protein